MKKRNKYSRNTRADEYIDLNLDDLWNAVKELQRLTTVIIISISVVLLKPAIQLVRKFINKFLNKED